MKLKKLKTIQYKRMPRRIQHRKYDKVFQYFLEYLQEYFANRPLSNAIPSQISKTPIMTQDAKLKIDLKK